MTVAELILVNGPPAAGKSTIAQRMVAARPLALNLDVDVVRGLLGGWIDSPVEAGLASRRLALAMAAQHLGGRRDVIVPQFLARPDFIVQLEEVACESGARFVEIALVMSREDAVDAFAVRSASSDVPTHVGAAEIVRQRGGVDALAEMYDDYVRLVDSRPAAIRVPVTRRDIDRTVRDVEAAILGSA